MVAKFGFPNLQKNMDQLKQVEKFLCLYVCRMMGPIYADLLNLFNVPSLGHLEIKFVHHV